MLSIMIVDDEDMLHELYGKLLELKGYQVVASAYNGVEAVDMYRDMAERPDLVLMDHRMPIKNGLDAMRDILDIDSGAQVVFLTADAAVAEHAMAAGAADVLLKPFRMDVLHKAVDDVATKVGR
ncbi:MAG: response regulator [Thermoplasmata archaeon]|nr:MAG: response regulator [Thermoplasmata archaeon]